MEASETLPQERQAELWQELALLRLMQSTPVGTALTCVRLRGWVEDPWPVETLTALYTALVERLHGVEALTETEVQQRLPEGQRLLPAEPLEQRLYLAGHCAQRLYGLESGLHLFYDNDRRLLPVEVEVRAVRELTTFATASPEAEQVENSPDAQAAPSALPPVRRMYSQQGPSLDFVQRKVHRHTPPAQAIFELWLEQIHQEEAG